MTRNELKIFLFLNLVRPHDRYCSFRSRFLPAISHKNSAVLRKISGAQLAGAVFDVREKGKKS